MTVVQTFNKGAFRRRLIQAIAKRMNRPLGKGWTMFAKEAGIGISVFQGYLDEKSPAEPRAENILRIAQTAGVTPEWLLYGDLPERVVPTQPGRRGDPATLTNQIPVFKFNPMLEIGRDGFPVGKPEIHIPRGLENNDPQAYGLLVEGTSLAPRFWDSDIVEIQPRSDIRSGHTVFVVTRRGERFLRQVQIQHRAERVVLLPWGPGEPTRELPQSEVAALHRVVSVRTRGMY